jgi:hypothetical protein
LDGEKSVNVGVDIFTKGNSKLLWKKVELEILPQNKIIKREDLSSMTRSQMITFIYISIEYNSKRKIKNTEENMLIQLSYPEFKDIIGNKNSFYEAIRFYEERGLLKKKDQSRNLFYLNPMILSNLTGHQQEELGLMNEKSNKTTE